MIIIISMLFGLFAYFAGGYIRKLYIPLIVISSIVAIIPIFFVIDVFEKLIVSGYIGLAIYVIVMIAGAFKPNTKIGKRLRSVRKEYSIIGFIFLIPHFYIYLVAFFKGSIAWELFGVIAFIIMIPLFITSFTIVRKKMKTKSWFKLQKFAYIAYLLTFIHLIVIGTGEHTIEYVLIFSTYFMLKLVNFVFNKQKGLSLATKVVYGVSLLTFGVLFYLGTQNTATPFDLLDEESSIVTTTSQDSSAETIEAITYSGPISLPDGDYSGSAYGYKDLLVRVVVSIEDGYISDIVLLSYGATEPERGVDFVQAAIAVINEMMSEQSIEVDTVAGATHTTEGVIEAVFDALH